MSIKKLAIAGGVVGSLLAGTAYASVIDRPFFQVLGVVVVWGADGSDATTANAPVVSDFVLLTPTSGSAGADLIAGNDVHSVVTGSLDPLDGSTANDSAVDPITGATGPTGWADDGTVDGVLDANDSLDAFGINASTDVGGGLVSSHNSSFYVASNAAFDIHAQATNFNATDDFDSMTLANIAFEMSLTTTGGGANGELAFGSAARNPATALPGETAPADAGFKNATITSLAGLTAQTKVFDGVSRTAESVGTLVAQSVRFDSVYQLDSDTSTPAVEPYDLSQGVGTVSADVTYTIFVP